MPASQARDEGSIPFTPFRSPAANYSDPAPSAPVPTSPRAFQEHPPAGAGERTVVMTPGMADIQAQLGIVIAQVKSLNKRMEETETQLSEVYKKGQNASPLSEPPANAV